MVVEGLRGMASLLFATIQIKATIAAKCIALVFAQTVAQRAKWNFKTERINRGKEQCHFHLCKGSQGTGSPGPLSFCWHLPTGIHQRHFEGISWIFTASLLLPVGHSMSRPSIAWFSALGSDITSSIKYSLTVIPTVPFLLPLSIPCLFNFL